MIGRRFVVIQDGGDRSRKDFWVHFGALEQTQVFKGFCGIRFIGIKIITSFNLGYGFNKANVLILRSRSLFVSLFCKDNVSECCCGGSNSPVFGEYFRPPIFA